MLTKTGETMMTHSARRNFVTIVSGLPRTGTSMMMRMLEAAGIPALTDEIRTADPDNPNGYYEFEPVKKTRDDASWIDAASDKAVKLVYLLLYDLPDSHTYRVVFMRRKLKEVIASQNKMLARLGQPSNPADDEKMMRLFEGHLAKVEQWLEEKDNFEVLYVDYGRMLSDPGSQVDKIAEFLGGRLDTQAMAGVVDPSLYRNRR